MKNKTLKILGLSLLVLYVFLVSEVNFRGADEPIYYAYTQSLIEDGDLNVIDEDYQKSYQITVSKTFNLPDFHNHGGIIVWWPFYLYGKIVFEAAQRLAIPQLFEYSLRDFTTCCMAFSTVFFTLILLVLLYRFCRIFYPRRICILSIALMFFGTPLFYYALFENGNANIVATIFSFLSLWFCFLAVNFRKIHWFLYGVFFSLMVTVKSELWIQLSFILPFFLMLIIMGRTRPGNIFYFFSGIIPVTILRFINSYIKYGTFHPEELMYVISVFRYRTTYIFNGLFDAFRGIFYTSPLMYLALAGFVWIIVALFRAQKKGEDQNLNYLLLFLLGFYAFLKVYLVGKIFSPGGDSLSMRVILSEWPVFVILLAHVFYISKDTKIVKPVVSLTSLLLVFWNLLIVSEYLCGLDWYYVAGAPPFYLRFQQIKYALEFIFSVKNLNIKIAGSLLLAVFSLIAIYYLSGKFKGISKDSFWYKQDKKARKPLTLLSSFTVYSAVTYLVVTGLNAYNNGKNVNNLKEKGFFEGANIIEVTPYDLTAIEKEHHLRMLFELRRFYALKGDIKKSDYIKKKREEIFGDQECVHSYFAEPLRPYEMLIEWYQTNKKYHKVIDSYKKMIDFDPKDIDAYISLGDFYAKIGDYVSAINTFKKALDVSPSSANVCMRLANIYDRVQENEKAVKYYKKYLQLRPASFNAYNNLGNIYLELGDYIEALKYFKKAERFQYYLHSLDFLSNMAAAYMNMGEYAKATESLKKILKIDPKFIDAYLNLAHLYNTKGDYPEAIKYYKKALQINPDYIEAYINIGDIYDTIAEYENAEDYYKKALQINPDYINAHIRLGIIYEKTGRYDSAVKSFEKAAEINPRSLEPYMNLGHIYNTRGDSDKALKYYKKIVAIMPSFSDAYLWISQVYSRQGNTSKQLEFLQKALNYDNYSLDFLSNMAAAYMNMGEYAKATESLKKILKIDPKSIDSYINLGDLYEAKGDHSEAIKYYKKALQINPDFMDAYIRLGIIYEKTGRYDSAVKSFEKASEINPNSLDILVQLGDIYRFKGDYPEAIEYYNRVVKMNPDFLEGYINLGHIYSNKGDYEKAIYYYGKALEINPEFMGLYLDLASVYFNKGDYVKAIEYYRKVLDINPQYLDAYINLAQIYTLTGDLDQSIDCHLKILELNPKFFDSYLSLGHIYNGKFQKEEAIKYFKKYLEYNPGDLEVNNIILDIYLRSNDLEGAEEYIDGLREEDYTDIADELEESLKQHTSD